MAVSYTLAEGLTVGFEHLWPLLAVPVAVGLLAYLVRERHAWGWTERPVKCYDCVV